MSLMIGLSLPSCVDLYLSVLLYWPTVLQPAFWQTLSFRHICSIGLRVDVGLIVSQLGRFLGDGNLQGLIRDDLTQLGVFLLQRPVLLDQIRAHAAIFLSPAIVRLLAVLQFLTQLKNGLTLPPP